LQLGEFGVEGAQHGAVGGGELVAGDAGEDLEDPGGGGCGAAAVLGVERQLGRGRWAMAWRMVRSISEEMSIAMKWQVSSPSMRAGSRSHIGATSWVPLSWAWRFSRLGCHR
jgi:hypothetical protein